MKTKTFGKKLTLNKKTIADLSIGKMMNVQGGLNTNPCGIPTSDLTICTEFVECPPTRDTYASGEQACGYCDCRG